MTISDFGPIYGAARAAAKRLTQKGELKRKYETTGGGLSIEGWSVNHLGSYSNEKYDKNTKSASEYWGQQELVLGTDGVLYRYSWDAEEHTPATTTMPNSKTERVVRAQKQDLRTADTRRTGGILRHIQSMGR